MKTNCTALASTLSLAYRTYEPFLGSTNNTLNDYLDSNGILISICMRQDIFHPHEPCSLPFYSNRVSASWIQAEVTGFRTIFGPETFPVAYILNPLASDLQCAYAADASTLGREKSGCGVMGQIDSWHKWLFRRKITKEKNERFGKDTVWGDIDCIDFFLGGQRDFDKVVSLEPRDSSSCEEMTEGKSALTSFSGVQLSFRIYSDIMGFNVCNAATIPQPRFANDSTAFYNGPCSWSPNTWSHMVESLIEILEDHPELHLWNEVVLKKPFFHRDVVKAVIYFGRGQTSDDSDQSDEAKKEAKRFRRPLLKIDLDALENGGDIFVCPNSDVADIPIDGSLASLLRD